MKVAVKLEDMVKAIAALGGGAIPVMDALRLLVLPDAPFAGPPISERPALQELLKRSVEVDAELGGVFAMNAFEWGLIVRVKDMPQIPVHVCKERCQNCGKECGGRYIEKAAAEGIPEKVRHKPIEGACANCGIGLIDYTGTGFPPGFLCQNCE